MFEVVKMQFGILTQSELQRIRECLEFYAAPELGGNSFTYINHIKTDMGDKAEEALTFLDKLEAKEIRYYSDDGKYLGIKPES